MRVDLGFEFRGQGEVVRVRYHLREEHSGTELMRVGEADQGEPAVDDRRRRRIARAKVDPDPHATCSDKPTAKYDASAATKPATGS